MDHPRRGFRNAYHDARGEGRAVNHKKIQRLWREEGLRVPQRCRRKRLGTSTTRNGCIESFNSRIRDGCLNINIWSLAQARVVISDWKQDYNHRRRHSSLGYQAPAVYAAACTHR
jgi:transposase InsO family protein